MTKVWGWECNSSWWRWIQRKKWAQSNYVGNCSVLRLYRLNLFLSNYVKWCHCTNWTLHGFTETIMLRVLLTSKSKFPNSNRKKNKNILHFFPPNNFKPGFRGARGSVFQWVSLKSSNYELTSHRTHKITTGQPQVPWKTLSRVLIRNCSSHSETKEKKLVGILAGLTFRSFLVLTSLANIPELAGSVAMR